MPHRPTIEPTERSMPPVMMTKVMPMARKALSATCLAIRIRLAADRKFGAAMEKNTSTAISAMKVLSFISVSSAEPLETEEGAALAGMSVISVALHMRGQDVRVH